MRAQFKFGTAEQKEDDGLRTIHAIEELIKYLTGPRAMPLESVNDFMADFARGCIRDMYVLGQIRAFALKKIEEMMADLLNRTCLTKREICDLILMLCDDGERDAADH